MNPLLYPAVLSVVVTLVS